MVSRHTHWWLALAWLLLSTTGVAGDYRLWLVTPESPAGALVPAELGRAVSVWLHYQGPADLDRIDTAPWQDHVAIARGYAAASEGVQRLRLRITPRRLGELTLPPLRLGSAQSDVLMLSVDPALEDDQALVPRWTVSDQQPWQREELQVAIDLDLDQPDAHLAVDDFAPPGFAVRPLPPTRQALPDGRTRYRHAWLLRPRKAGELPLALPRLSYLRDSVPRRRFEFPASVLQVRALPPYVTPTVPVGQVAMDPAVPDRLHAQGIAADALAAVLARAGLPASVVDRTAPDHGTRSEARIDWQAATPDAAGLVYFDPGIGRLRSLSPAAPPPVPWGWLGSALVVAVLLVYRKRRELAARWRAWRYRARLRQALARADDPETQLQTLLAQPLPGHGWPPRTPRAWLRGYVDCFDVPQARRLALGRAIDQMSAWRFGGAARAERLRDLV